MKPYARFMPALSAAVVLFVVSAVAHPANTYGSDGLRIRWVMAGMKVNADPQHPIGISSEMTLHTGDKIKMYLEAVNQCFFYLFHHGPEGKLRLIYPHALPCEMLASGTRLTIPQGDQWFELDEHTGTETFYVLVSPTPLHSIETLYADYRPDAGANGDAAARIIAVIERLRLQQRPLTRKAERPVAIGGTFRGSSVSGAETTESLLDHLAEDITAVNVFCRTYTIEHK
ncbi:MAG: DUF4384 domain-containing protein [Desulfobacterales bacterium]|nr:DUF4384 domain-containing protein [Desulfobacterales bacterium]MDJ0886938.1 DUF4384 domain-containing protein [Desulfobacterales bacterium]